MDIGSGGGFPALVLKIARPDLQVLMVESIKKKALFLKDAIRQLKLTKIAVANHRAEELARLPDFLNRFDVVTARAVAKIHQLIDWGKPFLKEQGYWFLWKSQRELQELEATAVDLNLTYQIFAPPQPLRQQFPRLANQLWFKIHRSASTKN
ncbi:MAG: 16S rRNA (guanine(527)-N(7))-methyltransferase RsmG, partial [Calditrichaeota bacterium]